MNHIGVEIATADFAVEWAGHAVAPDRDFQRQCFTPEMDPNRVAGVWLRLPNL